MNNEQIQVGSRLTIWSSKYNCEKQITITYKRLNIVFFLYDDDKDEDWVFYEEQKLSGREVNIMCRTRG